MRTNRRGWIRGTLCAIAWIALSANAARAQALPTKLLVRVVAHDAKIIGSGVGGARVTIRDAETGAVLAEGVQQGSTGNTTAIMRTPWERGATIFDTEGAASFLATLDLTKPTRVEVSAEGPLDTPEAMQRGSKTFLMVPGVDVVGEGLLIELNGLRVSIESPADHAELTGRTVPVRATVTMLCGCPTEPGGLWNADHKTITARLVRDGTVMAEDTLHFAGRTSQYETTLSAPAPGAYTLQVIAVDPTRANTGMATRTLTVR